MTTMMPPRRRRRRRRHRRRHRAQRGITTGRGRSLSRSTLITTASYASCSILAIALTRKVARRRRILLLLPPQIASQRMAVATIERISHTTPPSSRRSCDTRRYRGDSRLMTLGAGGCRARFTTPYSIASRNGSANRDGIPRPACRLLLLPPLIAGVPSASHRHSTPPCPISSRRFHPPMSTVISARAGISSYRRHYCSRRILPPHQEARAGSSSILHSARA